jgi:hypothetical protein
LINFGWNAGSLSLGANGAHKARLRKPDRVERNAPALAIPLSFKKSRRFVINELLKSGFGIVRNPLLLLALQSSWYVW